MQENNKENQQENCTHDCGSCGVDCPSRKAGKESFLAPANPYSHVGKIVGVVSGKGGVGKSMITSLLALCASGEGLRTGILDADLTGPSIPKVFGLSEKASATEDGLLPVITPQGISVMSVNLVLENVSDPVIWRGPIIAGVVKQFWMDVQWGDIDTLFVDMPPGTGDVPLTVFQSLPLDGIIVVTTPQDLVSLIVEKAIRMAEKMDIPVLGIVENMSYFTCPDCGKKTYVFGESRLAQVAKEHGVANTLQLPIDPEFAQMADEGEPRIAEGLEKSLQEFLNTALAG